MSVILSPIFAFLIVSNKLAKGPMRLSPNNLRSIRPPPASKARPMLPNAKSELKGFTLSNALPMPFKARPKRPPFGLSVSPFSIDSSLSSADSPGPGGPNTAVLNIFTVSWVLSAI